MNSNRENGGFVGPGPARDPSRERLLRLHDVVRSVALGKTAIWDRVRAGRFPKPVRIGVRAVAWLESEVQAWIAARIAARDDAPAGAGT
jgi:prophage regulatory protein